MRECVPGFVLVGQEGVDRIYFPFGGYRRRIVIACGEDVAELDGWSKGVFGPGFEGRESVFAQILLLGRMSVISLIFLLVGLFGMLTTLEAIFTLVWAMQ